MQGRTHVFFRKQTYHWYKVWSLSFCFKLFTWQSYATVGSQNYIYRSYDCLNHLNKHWLCWYMFLVFIIYEQRCLYKWKGYKNWTMKSVELVLRKNGNMLRGLLVLWTVWTNPAKSPFLNTCCLARLVINASPFKSSCDRFQWISDDKSEVRLTWKSEELSCGEV